MTTREHLVPNVFGHKMYADPGDLGLRIADLNGHRAEDHRGEIGFLRRTLRPGLTVIDVGANVGLYTLLFARQVGPTGSVHAFEPGPKSFDLLRANIRINEYSNARAVHAAVMDYTGEIDLFVCRTGESDNRVAGTLSDHDQRDRVRVPCVSLDEHFPKGTRIDFLKIDVQGAEFRVLQGARRLLSENPQIVIVSEYAPGGLAVSGVEPRSYLEHLQGLGFRLFDLPEDGNERPTSVDWLLANIGGSNARQQTNIVASHGVPGTPSTSQ